MKIGSNNQNLNFIAKEYDSVIWLFFNSVALMASFSA